jgi:hypothetical protein
MLKVVGIRDDGPGRRLFEVREEGVLASPESLARVVRFATELLLENGLTGAFRVDGDGLLALDFHGDSRSYFHDGILFAALDVYNDPVKNPTISGLPPAGG